MNKELSSLFIEEYHHQLHQAHHQVVKKSIILTSIFLILSIPSAIFYNQVEMFQGIFPITFSLLVMAGIFTLLLMKYYVSEKPLYLSLYPRIIEDIVENENIKLSYEAYPKEVAFIKTGRLFPIRFASKLLRFKISFESKQGHRVDFYDAYVYSQSSDSTTIFLNGLYVVVPMDSIPSFQLRSTGSPVGKEPRFVKLQKQPGQREFVMENGVSRIDSNYLRVFDDVKSRFDTAKVFLSGTNSQLHMGIGLPTLTRKVKVLTQETYDTLRSSILAIVSKIEAIDQVMESTNSRI